MRLTESQAKSILLTEGVPTPRQFALLTNLADIDQVVTDNFPCVAKVQTVQGKRGKRGLIRTVQSKEELREFWTSLTAQADIMQGGLLLEELISNSKEIYCSISYDYTQQSPIIVFKTDGGTDVEQSDQPLWSLPIHVQSTISAADLQALNLDQTLIALLVKIGNQLISTFFKYDCLFLEINPLAITSEGSIVALDAKIELDNRAKFRQTEHFSRFAEVRNRIPSERERLITEINQKPEYKGTPCRYTELDGDIALLLSGGGASILVFDYLVAAGIKPGNYSEFSGNPVKEKVEALTRVVISKPDQRGLLIAGAVANFTKIDESMKGIAAALAEVKPTYPIVIRRGGPGEDEAKRLMLECAAEHHLDITWFGSETSIPEACDYFLKKFI